MVKNCQLDAKENHGGKKVMEIKGIWAAIIIIGITIVAGLMNSWELGLL